LNSFIGLCNSSGSFFCHKATAYQTFGDSHIKRMSNVSFAKNSKI
jgi:hypothetical protein